MIACVTLAEFANLATIVGAVVAVGALLYTALQVRSSTLTSRANFWLELEKMFQSHDTVHLNLRPGGKWSDGVTGPTAPQEWAAIEDYMGLFEHCEIMIGSGLIDEATFSDIFVYRLHNIVANQTIVKDKLQREKDLWKNFVALLQRFDIRLPT